MDRRKEYLETLILSKQHVDDIEEAQFEMRRNGFENQNERKLRDALSAFTGVLSLAFKLPTPVTLAAAVISAVASFPNDLDLIIHVCRAGEDYLREVSLFMKRHPEYDLVKVKLPFLEFIDEEFRIVQGNGKIIAVHSGSGWKLS